MKQKQSNQNPEIEEVTDVEATEAEASDSAESVADKTAQKESKDNAARPEEPSSYEEAIEAILFAAGHPVTYEQLAKTLDLRKPIIRNIVKEYAERYNKSKIPRGVILLAFDNECQLCTKSEFLPYIRDALGIRKNGTLSSSNMETLAIIAYHQPVTRAYIDAVRGVDSSYAVSSLLERGLIESKGRLDAPGRPTLFGTSAGFLRCFGLHSVDELPAITNEEIQAVFQKVEEQLEAEAAQQAEELNPNQISISDLEEEAENAPEASAEKGDAEAEAADAEEDDIVPPEIASNDPTRSGESLDALGPDADDARGE